MCPFLHFQIRKELSPAKTDSGSHPSASVAIFGLIVFKSLKPTSSFLLAHTGQEVFRNVRDTTEVMYECPSGHFHFNLECEPERTVDGSQPSASAAIAGKMNKRSLVPARTFLFEQIGHILFPVVR